jgi:thiol-disulfide isomerase/thioredoxin
MKKYFLLFVASLFVLSCFSQKNKSTKAILSGKIVNPLSDTVYVHNTMALKEENRVLGYGLVDSTGLFKLTIELDIPKIVNVINGSEQATVVLSPKDDIYIHVNTIYFDESIRFTGVGAEKNNALIVLSNIEDKNKQELFKLANQDDIDTSFLFKKLEEDSDKFISIAKEYNKEFPDIGFLVGSMILAENAGRADLKELLLSRIETNKQLSALKSTPAIDFSGIDIDGAPIKLSDFKGKIIVLDFWATWCGPCKKEFPAYKKLEEEYGNDVHFISVAVWCDEEAWKTMAKSEGFKNNIFLSKEMEAQIDNYLIKSIPRYIVIDKNFNIVDVDAPRPSSGELQKYWLK